MINEHIVKKYCRGDITQIENYNDAIADSKMWHCHHRMEVQPDDTILDAQWMIDHDIYFDLDPCMLVFLTKHDHMSLHANNRDLTGFITANRMKGKKHKAETKAVMSCKMLGNKSLTSRHWYNNGISNVATFECPIGYVPGKLTKKVLV